MPTDRETLAQRVAWLVRTLSRMAEHLKAGDILMTGALGPMAALTPDDHVEAAIGGSGAVSFTYRDERP